MWRVTNISGRYTGARIRVNTAPGIQPKLDTEPTIVGKRLRPGCHLDLPDHVYAANSRLIEILRNNRIVKAERVREETPDKTPVA